MDIDQGVYYWMIDRGVLEEDSRNKILPNEGIVKIHETIVSKFENGESIA